MPIQIDRMEAHVDVAPSSSSTASSAAPKAQRAADPDRAVAALRPLVAKALAEELDLYLRMHG